MTVLTWLVTGCSTGFGESFVHGILARGDNVIATGRKADQRLAHLKNTGAAILDLDMSASESDIQAKAREALSIYGGIDVLVHNAGYVEVGFVEDFDYNRWLAQFTTNFFGVTNLTRAILPHMREKRSGTIAINGSVCGWRSLPGCAGYNATKFALEGGTNPHSQVIHLRPLDSRLPETERELTMKPAYTENLQLEVAPFNIRSIVFEAGHFRTFINAETNRKDDLSNDEDYQPLKDMLLSLLKKNNGNQLGDPKAGVERMIDVIKGEGMAEGKLMPARLPLGTDALAIVRAKCMDTLKICEEWEEVIG
ncbi:MAG: hypothetical protein Q9184_002198, partial [Pyrenodesmia sp. 2 TL-2023]